MFLLGEFYFLYPLSYGTIINNYFRDIKVHGVALYKYKNLKITNNVFENYKFDAIREYNGESLSSGQLLIRNNQFRYNETTNY